MHNNLKGKQYVSKVALYHDIDFAPDYDFWSKRKYWSRKDTLALLARVDPRFVRTKLKIYNKEYYEHFKFVTDGMRDALDDFPPKCSPEKAIKLAREKGLEISPELEKYFLNDVNEKNVGKKVHKGGTTNSNHRKSIADAAVYLLTKSEESCKNSLCKFTRISITSSVDESRGQFKDYPGWIYKTGKPAFGSIETIIGKCLKGKNLKNASAKEIIEFINEGKKVL